MTPTIRNMAIVVVSFSLMTPLIVGCATSSGTGTLAGAGAGALMGQAIGRNTTGTLIGAGVGAAGGYLIGNEMDRKRAKDQPGPGAATAELAPLAGTTWTLVSITPESARAFSAMTIDFRRDGTLVTTRTESNGKVRTDEEYYRVVSNTLIVNDRDYIINGPFVLQQRALTFVVGDVTSRWSRVGG